MRFIVDQPVSPRVAEALVTASHDAVHVRSLGLAAAPDSVILARAAAEKRVVVTQDRDYGDLLAASGAREPSVIRFRLRDGRAHTQVRTLLASLERLEPALLKGAIVIISESGFRIRLLPIRRASSD